MYNNFEFLSFKFIRKLMNTSMTANYFTFGYFYLSLLNISENLFYKFFPQVRLKIIIYTG